jgi:peptidoglycan/xylan/chitin deacetylase (PgdA/CDA1 family)
MHFNIVFNNKYKKITFLVVILSINVSILSFISSSYGIQLTNPTQKPCNCVVFRMDDIQDYWLNKAQVSVMDLFFSKNQSLSLGLIMNGIGNDTAIIDKIDKGFRNGLFELDLHGWDHVDYNQLPESEQEDSLNKSNVKLISLFEVNSSVFITPETVFDNNTLKAMKNLGIKVISNALESENDFDGGKSIFNPKSKTKFLDGGAINQQQIYHIPETTSFTNYEDGKWIKNPTKNIINSVSSGLDEYGYAVIVLHPQDFAVIKNDTFVNEVNDREISDLSGLIDTLSSKNIKISTFSKIADIPAKTPPIPTSKSCAAFYGSREDKEYESLRMPYPKPVEGLHGDRCTQTQIYNTYGKYLYDKAAELDISPSTAAAVLFVETRGSGFGPDGKMVIRFEACDFYNAWGKDHPKEFSNNFYCDLSGSKIQDKFRNSSNEELLPYHGNHYKEWRVFEAARALDETAAKNSISMGLGQIMGFNHNQIGYDTVDRMFSNMSKSIRAQLDGFFLALTFNNNGSCLDSLKTDDFVGFAKCYNASGQDLKYGNNIKRAVIAFNEITRGEKYWGN